MGHSPLEGRDMAVDGCTDNLTAAGRPVVNDRITLHGDDADARGVCTDSRFSCSHSQSLTVNR